MSDAITVGGIEYISSKRAAQISGYAQDYIGQLCRGGTVQAQRIGGLWYIVLESLYKHKQKADSYIPVAPHREAGTEMEAIVSFDGKDYVSAARASDMSGYTRDYVGQLAREGAVFSRQVGGRWFVDREALMAHKKSKDALLAAVQVQSVGLPPKIEQKPVAMPLVAPTPAFFTYTAEKRDLIPDLKPAPDTGSRIPIRVEAAKPAHLGHTRTVHIGIPRTIYKPISDSARPKAMVMPSRPKHHVRRSLQRLQVGALVTGVATIVVFLALGVSTWSEKAVLSSNSTSTPDEMAASAEKTGTFEAIASYLESKLVPEVNFSR